MFNDKDVVNAEDLPFEYEGKSSYVQYLKEQLLPILKEYGVSVVNANFNGEHDSGAFEDPEVDFCGDLPEGTKDFLNIKNILDHPISYYRHAYSVFENGKMVPKFKLTANTVSEAILDMFYACLAIEHGGWENNEGAYGHAELDVARGEVDLEVKVRVMEVEIHEHVY